MSASTRSSRRFLLGFALAVLLIAGVLSSQASSSPDGLDAATTRGCDTVETDTGASLVGDCIAKNAEDHHLSASPLADYTVSGRSGFTGVAGIIGAAATFVVAAAAFRLLARGRRHRAGP